MSIFLTSESFAFSIKVEASTIQDEGSFLQNPINHQALFVEELATVKTFEQNFYPQIHFLSNKNSRFNTLFFVSSLSENKDNFLFKKNLKKLLTQQIFPFHLFW
ncbi:MAG TPA: hypothetical protein DCS66_16385 [Flavobacteriaceae bacterium]|nr:hypothetical protein [Flavobacteriaceae bacterium]HAT66146.1 hypothetical protein [Flavobacteriaceae bacterium]|tara:strand:- start:1512 stop:1823 length:312 start_codon:yes stop_codon:yes gene_type:complete